MAIGLILSSPQHFPLMSNLKNPGSAFVHGSSEAALPGAGSISVTLGMKPESLCRGWGGMCQSRRFSRAYLHGCNKVLAPTVLAACF